MLLFVVGLVAEEPKAVKHEAFDGYFVSNKFEPDAAESFVVVRDQTKFDAIFGVAFVMGDKSHRLPPEAFATQMVIGVIKRGMATYDFQVTKVVQQAGELEVHYSAAVTPQVGATFASPLILGIPKQAYKTIKFVEGEKVVKTWKLND
jgi:hypothetical protein